MNSVQIAGLLLAWPLCASPALAQEDSSASQGIIHRIEFRGLHRISPATLRAQIASREGQPLAPARVEEDVRALDRLGWFDSVSAETHVVPMLLARAEPPPGVFGYAAPAPEDRSFPTEPRLRLVFALEERPFLAEVKFRGSRALPGERIPALLAAQGIRLKLAAPVNPTELWRAARAIEAELASLGYPNAEARVRLHRAPTMAVRARFEIADGPRVPVAEVAFTGNAAFSGDTLRRQMKRVAPHAWLAGLRGKTIYTPERLGEDLERLQAFYHNHGYAQARLGAPRVEFVEGRARRWLPWPQRESRPRFHLSIPVEEGTFYRLEGVVVEGVAPRTRAALAPALRGLGPGTAYSEEKLLRAREALARAAPAHIENNLPARPEVDLLPEFHREAGTVRVTLRARSVEPYTVRRLEFVGHHRFSDRYFRRRVGLKEGEPFDPYKLERGLAQLSRTGFLRPFESRDVRVRFDEARRTADVAIQVEEIGRQRLSLVGGTSGLGGTLGIAYHVFDLLGGEELLTTHLEGGPGNLHLLLSVAKEGLFGTPGSFGLSLFHNVLRPRLPGASGRDRLFTSRSSGLGLGWDCPLTPRDTLGMSYELARVSSRFDLPLPPQISGLPATPGRLGDPLQLRQSRRALGLAWRREELFPGRTATRLEAAAAVSGGRLGGDENLLRGSLEYAQAYSDPLTQGRNSWAFRSQVAGVSSYGGRPLFFHQRLFAGEELLRGFRPGEVGPLAHFERPNSTGAPAFGAQTTGANLVAALNTEYRVPLHPRAAPGEQRAEAAAFFDAGTGWLLPRWLGGARPGLLPGSNGALRASTGVELRFRVPLVNETVRFHYSLNPLRLARSFLLPDGSRFRASERRGAFGWAVGSFF